MAQIHFRKGHPGVVPSTWLIRPNKADTAPPLVAVHGLNRETDLLAELLAPRADATGRTIVVPLFDRGAWPRFQRAACAQRSDWALLELLRLLRRENWIGSETPDLSGFSGGAQFAHRFAWLYPTCVARLCLVAPGWWTFPDASGAYPAGLDTDGSPGGASVFRLRANLARFLDREISVKVGALDVERDRNLRQDPSIMSQQGQNRVERAQAWTAAMILAAQQRGIRPQIDFDLMDNCGHSFADCVANGSLAQAFVPQARGAADLPQMAGNDPIVEVA